MQEHLRSITSTAIVATLAIAGTASSAVIYVDGVDGLDSNPGTGNWLSAYKTLQKALAEAGADDQIWVKGAEDTGIAYYPDQGPGVQPGDPEAFFHLQNNVAIYGGFEGDESLLAQRNPDKFITILSGDIDGDGFSVELDPQGVILQDTDNSQHVVKADGIVGARVDGFIIEGGVSAGAFFGGGMLIENGHVDIVNCTFRHNVAGQGGAVRVTGFVGEAPSDQPVRVVNCRFHHNYAHNRGGALYFVDAGVRMTNSLLFQNQAPFAGGVYAEGCFSQFNNCTMSDNHG